MTQLEVTWSTLPKVGPAQPGVDYMKENLRILSIRRPSVNCFVYVL
jgi:hypothetical protein